MSDAFEKGLAIRRELFGSERTAASFASPDELTQKFQRLVTVACFGEVWADTTVSWQDRSLISMSIVGTLKNFSEFELHVRMALRNGCSEEQIIQVVQHLSVYSGITTGYEAFKVAHKVLSEHNK